MDAYEDALTKVLLPDGAPAENWHQSEEFSPYLQHLSSCGVGKLGSECSDLQDEQNAVLEQTKELAYKEYLTFIHASDCSKDMLTQLGSLEERLSGASTSVSDLQQTLASFVTKSRSLLHARQLNTTTLAKHTQLLEILELSQLLDTCVRNNYHDEALEIIAYVRRLEKRHGHIPIIKSIVGEVQASSRQMLSQLLSQLRTGTSLPECLKVVGLIRTLDVFTECQLRIKFLHARDSWLGTALRGLPHHEPYQHLSKSVECARVHLFDIVTQYRAIFSDDHNTHLDARADAVDLQAILQSWILFKVTGILSMLRRDLSKGGISGSNLESLLAQCMFFGQSLSRIGADFRGLLPEIFQEAAARQLERDIRAANHKFDESLSAFSLLDACPVSPALGLQQPGGGTRPPLSLLEFPPLGHYLNALVTAFNCLRLCCFTALLPVLLKLLTHSLEKVVRSLVELQQLECSGFSADETASFGRVCAAVRGALVPHINTCLAALYPRHVLAPRMGLTPHHLAKMNFGQLDVAAICLPLEPFLSVLESAEESLGSEAEKEIVPDDGVAAVDTIATEVPTEVAEDSDDVTSVVSGPPQTTLPISDEITTTEAENVTMIPPHALSAESVSHDTSDTAVPARENLDMAQDKDINTTTSAPSSGANLLTDEMPSASSISPRNPLISLSDQSVNILDSPVIPLLESNIPMAHSVDLATQNLSDTLSEVNLND